MIDASPRLEFANRIILAASALIATIVIASISVPAQSNSDVSRDSTPVHTLPPSVAMAMPREHPLYGHVPSLAGFLELTEGDQHPTVWIKAVDESGRVALYTTSQLESLGYRVQVSSERRVMLTYDSYRIEIVDPASR